MKSEDLIQEIVRHASGVAVVDEHATFADAVFDLKRGGDPPDFSAFASELERLLSELNAERATWVGQTVPLQVCYAMSEIQLLGMEVVLACSDELPTSRAAQVFLWRITTTWNAVLAGDIDDVAEHVRLEARGRGIDLDSPRDS